MVRSDADRPFVPERSLLEEVGDMMIATGKTIVSALRPPWGASPRAPIGG